MTQAGTLDEELQRAETEALTAISAAGDVGGLERLKPEILGKKSPIKQLMRRLGELSAEERPAAGQLINSSQARVEQILEEKLEALKSAELARRLEIEQVDITLPASTVSHGSLHPLTRTLNEIVQVFTSMGYQVATGPDAESEFNNFDALNMKPDHPARDMHDTFYLDMPPTEQGDTILRTHTSPVQIRYLLGNKPPVAIIAPGRVYRVDDVDATHSPVFHQIEGLLVDRNISFAHLKGTLGTFLRAMFGDGLATRFRPSFFPFTEPSAEVDVQCFVCRGADSACRVCKGTAWIEIGGAGMVHPNVLTHAGVDPAEFTGFAFGLGVERVAMLRYGLASMRPFYENDARFLRQF